MAQNDRVVVGIDVAKDKVDACIRSLSQRRTFPSTAEGRRQLISWLRKHKVTKAVMEASGGYEREWATALRKKDVEVRIVDPKRVRSFARSAGRLAKNDAIDAEMIAWFAETFDKAKGQAYDAAREKLRQMVNARQGLLDIKTMLDNKGEQDVPEPVQRIHARLLKKIAAELATLEVAIAATVKATPHFAERGEIIESVPGLAEITSAGLIAAMPELGLEEVAAWVMRGTADVGVTNVLPSHPQFRQVSVFVDRLILCGSPERARQVPDDLSWANLTDQAPILWEQSELTQTLVPALAAHRADASRLADPGLRLSSSMAVISALQGQRYIGVVPERAVSPLFASGMLVRIGLLEIPVHYWMFALRERDIDPLAAHVARAASFAAHRDARLHPAEQM